MNPNNTTAHRLQGSGGFTLLELLIALVVIGIVAAVAYPSYTQHVIKSNRSAAQAHLIELAQKQQQVLADSRAYAATVAELNTSTPTAVSSKYTITIALVAGPPPSFTITATPTGAQLADGDLSINSAGTKTPSTKW